MGEAATTFWMRSAHVSTWNHVLTVIADGVCGRNGASAPGPAMADSVAASVLWHRCHQLAVALATPLTASVKLQAVQTLCAQRTNARMASGASGMIGALVPGLVEVVHSGDAGRSSRRQRRAAKKSAAKQRKSGLAAQTTAGVVKTASLAIGACGVLAQVVARACSRGAERLSLWVPAQVRPAQTTRAEQRYRFWKLALAMAQRSCCCRRKPLVLPTS